MAGSVLTAAAGSARAGDLESLERVLSESPEVIVVRDGHGRTLLDLACRAATGDIAIPLVPGTPEQHAAVDRILAAAADPSASDDDGWTPLHTAAMAGHLDLAKRLVAAGASVRANARGREGGSPLSYALFYAKAYMAEALTPVYPDNLRTAAALGRGLDRFFGRGGELTTAALKGLDFYAPVFFPARERTLERQEVLDEALCWAARNDRCGTMQALVDLGADVNANPFRGTPLLWPATATGWRPPPGCSTTAPTRTCATTGEARATECRRWPCTWRRSTAPSTASTCFSTGAPTPRWSMPPTAARPWDGRSTAGPRQRSRS